MPFDETPPRRREPQRDTLDVIIVRGQWAAGRRLYGPDFDLVIHRVLAGHWFWREVYKLTGYVRQSVVDLWREPKSPSIWP